MLDGLGLENISGCAGLSKFQVYSIISQSHARNNRAVLFNPSCAMVVHVTYMLPLEDSQLAQVVSDMHSVASEKGLSPSLTATIVQVLRQRKSLCGLTVRIGTLTQL